MNGGGRQRTDPRSERTREALRQAILAECAERPLAEVTVAAVVQRAGTARTTFYLHYTDLSELALDACLQIARDGVEALHAWRGMPNPDKPPALLVDFLQAIAENGGLYRSLLGPDAAGPLGDVLRRELRERSRTERELAGAPHAEVVAAAVSGTFASVLADWLHADAATPSADVASQVWRMLIALHRAV